MIAPRPSSCDAGRSTFLALVGGQIAAGIGNAQVNEEERKRAEALAKIDRTKTAFFSNVSHEFRTPLTLMMGPLEDLLARTQTDLTAPDRGMVEVAHRNATRLLKLVNTLDFSRIEAVRMPASYAPVNLAALTTELASNFRSATDRAGLRPSVDRPRLVEPVYVDHDMWEKIVLNLLLNAFKLTFDGEIAVELWATPQDRIARLSVRDSGIG